MIRMLRLEVFVVILLAKTIASVENSCIEKCHCTAMSTERCKEGQVVVEGCRCCYICLPAHLRCMGMGPACNPITCNDKYCWCYNPNNNKEVGSLLPYRVEYAYLNNCEDLWYFFNVHKFRKSMTAKVNKERTNLRVIVKVDRD